MPILLSLWNGITQDRNTWECYMYPKYFSKVPGKQNYWQFCLPTCWNVFLISHINYWDQVNSKKNFSKLSNDSLCRNRSGPSPLLNATAYWEIINMNARVKNCLRYWQTTMIMGGKGLKKIKSKIKGVCKKLTYF